MRLTITVVFLITVAFGLGACRASVKDAEVDTGDYPIIYDGDSSPEAELFLV